MAGPALAGIGAVPVDAPTHPRVTTLTGNRAADGARLKADD